MCRRANAPNLTQNDATRLIQNDATRLIQNYATNSTQNDAASSPPLLQTRQQDPSGTSQVKAYPMSQPNLQPPAAPSAQEVALRDHHSSAKVSAKIARRKHARESRARPSRGQIVQYATQPEQHSTDSSSSNPTTPTKGGPFCCQEDSNLVAQAPSLATVQGGDLAQPIIPDSNLHLNLDYPLAQPNGTQVQPHIAAYNPDPPFMNNDHGQEGHNVSAVFPSPDSVTQYGGNPTHLTTSDQQTPQMSFERTVHHLPGCPEAHTSLGSTRVQPSAYPGFPTLPGCPCGLSCNCIWCKTHPLNEATQRRVNEMTRVLMNDHYLDGNPHLSQSESGTGGPLLNGTNTGLAVGQGDPPLPDDEALNSNPRAPLQAPIHQEGSVSDNDLSNHFSSPTIRNSEYYTVEYPLDSNFSDPPDTCLGNIDCVCTECLTYQGYNELPN